MSDDIGDVYIGLGVDAMGFSEDVEAHADEAGALGGVSLAKALGEMMKRTIGEAVKPALDKVKEMSAVTAAEISRMKGEITVEAATTRAKEQALVFLEWLKAQSAKISIRAVGLGTLGAAVPIPPQVLKIIPKVSAAALKATVTTIRMTLIAATVTAGAGGLGALLLNASQGILGVAGSLLQLLPVAAMLPGILAGAGASVLILKAGIKQLSADVGPMMAPVGKAITDAFIKNGEKPVVEAWKSLAPDVQKVFTEISGDMGTFVGTIATDLKGMLGNGGLAAMFSGVGPAIKILSDGMKPILQSFVTLATFGQQYLPKIAQWVSDIGAKFNTWVQGVTTSGKLSEMMAGVVTQLKLLWSVAQSAWSIVTGLINAANQAGSGGLSTLATMLKAIAAVINGPAFQTTLIAFFKAASAGVQAMLPGLATLGPMFLNLSGAIANLLSSGGAVVGQIIGALAKTLSQPIVAAGLNAAINGIAKGFAELAPVLPVIAGALGPILSLFGTLASNVLPIVGSLLQAVVPIISALVGVLQPLVATLGGGLISALTDLGQGFATAGGAAGGFANLLTGVVTGLVAGISKILPVILGIIVQVVSGIAAALPKIVTTILGLVPVIISGLIQLISVVPKVLPQVVTAIISGIRTLVPMLLAAITALIPVLITNILSVLKNVVSLIAQLLPLLITAAVQLFMGLLTGLLQVLPQLITGLIAALIQLFMAIVAAIPQIIIAAMQLFLGIITALVQALPSIIVAVVNAIPKLILAIVDAIPLIIDGALKFFLGAIEGLVKAIPQIIVAILIAIPQLIVALVSMLPQLILGAIKLFLGIITGLVTALPQIIKALLLAIPQMIQALINAGPQFAQAGIQLVQGLIGGIGSMVGKLVDAAVNLAKNAFNAVKNALGIHSPSKLFHDEVGVMIGQGLINGLESMRSSVNKSISSLVKVPQINANVAVAGGSGIGFGGGSGYGYSQIPGSMGGPTVNFGPGSIGISGVSDPNRAAQETVNRIANKVGMK